jgi:hypothetical protein
MRALGAVTAIGVLLWTSFGCSTQTGGYVGAVYYLYGPESALRVADPGAAGPGERALVELERAMALFELGRYEASLRALDTAEHHLAADVPADARPWQPDAHERVLMATLALVNELALQSGPRAAARADAALAGIAASGCGDCEWVFTRTLAALAFEQNARFDDALAAVDGIDLDGDGGELIRGLRIRCKRGIAGSEPAGLAPPPVTNGRSVTVVLLLGIGPYRVPDRFEAGPATTVKWHEWEPYEPQSAASAVLRVSGIDEPVPSVELSPVAELATTAGASGLAGLRAAVAQGAPAPKRDLRHWIGLPASLQLVEVTLPPETSLLELVVVSPAGYEADTESIWIPETWIGGRLFIARRVP